MYSVIIDNKPEKDSTKNPYIKINFGKMYLLLLIFSVALIYFYGVYQDNYLLLLIPYRILWPISIILIGISIFRVKNSSAFSVALFITTLSVAITITSIFVYSSNVENSVITSSIPISEATAVSADINLVTTKTKIQSDDIDKFKADFKSNYEAPIYSNYIDENKIENIAIKQTLFQPGIGSYDKSSDIVFPNSVPLSFKINTNFSSIEASLSRIKLKSGHILANSSLIDIEIKPIDIYEDTVLDINANFSRVNIVVSKDMPTIVSYTSSFSQTEFIGLSRDPNSSNVYQTIVQESTPDQESIAQEESKEIKKLIINLKSNFSQIKVIQK
jgi:hypothetical protein